jgi:hypothetical protein
MMWNVVLPSGPIMLYVSGVLIASLATSHASHILQATYHCEFMQEADVLRKTRLVLSGTGPVALSPLRFCSIGLFLVICVDVNLLLCGLNPPKTPAEHFSAMTQAAVLLLAVPNLTHSSVIVRTAFRQFPSLGWSTCGLFIHGG